MDGPTSRRRLIAAAAVASSGLIAGCRGDDSDPSTPGDADYTAAEQRGVTFLTSDPETDSFDGSFADETDADRVVVDVGADGNGGNFAYAPTAVRVSTGTTVSWEWTGRGNSHNVQSTGESDFELASELKTDGDPFTRTFEESGVALYYCGPHRSFGMKGVVVVV